MKFEIDREIIRSGERVVASRNEDEYENIVVGYRRGRSIYLTPMNMIEVSKSYFHEGGHIFGDIISFRSGCSEGQRKLVLSFDDIKDRNIAIRLDEGEIDYFKRFTKSKQVIGRRRFPFHTLNRILNVFFMDQFDPSIIKLHFLSQKNLDKLVARDELGSKYDINYTGEIEFINSRAGRNVELPAILTEAGCLLILENTLKKHGIIDSDLKMGNYGLASHERALRIVARAFESRGVRLPSTKDLYPPD